MIFTVFKKELLDTIRDRRTLLFMIVIPILIFPLIAKISSLVSSGMADKTKNQTLKVAVVGYSESLVNALKKDIGEAGKYEWLPFEDTLLLKQAIRDESVDLGLYIGKDFDDCIAEGEVGTLHVYHNAVDIGKLERLQVKINLFKQQLSQEKLSKLGVKPEMMEPFTVGETNIASEQEMLGKLAGGILPYIFIIFGFLGCMYPAFDLFTGEKERGTIETILTTPLPRWKILTGKMLVVALSGLLAALCGVLGLYFASQSMMTGEFDASIGKVISAIFSPMNLLSMVFLIVPLVLFFSGLIVPISIYAKTFKEAQSVASPLNMLVILPAMVGMFPGVEYNAITAFIPVVNVVLATKEIIAGTINWYLYAGTFISLCVFAVFAILFSHRQFGKESNVSTN